MRKRLKRNGERARLMAAAFLADDRGQATGIAMETVSLIVALTVGSIVAAFLLPIGVDELVAVDTSAWSEGATALWDILDVIMVLSLFLAFVAIALAAAERV